MISLIKHKMKMNIKNILVSFLVITSLLLLVSTVSAIDSDGNLTSNVSVTVNGIDAEDNDVSVIAGETITVKVYFTAEGNASEVTVKAELNDVVAETSEFDIEDDKAYKKVLNLKVPYDFDDDELSTKLDFEVEIKGETDTGEDFKETITDTLLTLTVQRPSYNIDFKSISVSSSVEAGKTLPVDIVLKNIGYNDLEDVYVTVRIPALELEKTGYFGDLVAIEIENNDDETDTISERIYLQIPYDVEPGIYTLEVEAANDDLIASEVKQIAIENELLETVIKSGNDLIIVNPADYVKVYKIIAESPASVSESIVVVPAGSSRTVTVSPNAEDYNFNVNVFSGEKLVATVNFTGSMERAIASPIIVLTVVLAIIFLVLLVVLIVLMGKKPEKTEEFGESYY